MKAFKSLSSLLLLIAALVLFQSWGFFAHRKINKMAVFTLPPEMIGFYKNNIEYLSHNAVNPDKRRYAVEGEAPKHYIDIDHYAVKGKSPFEIMPRRWNKAVEKFSEDTLMEYGIVPWHIASMTKWLTKAFIEKDANRILYLSADLGHYVADAHVPLHTTVNYNGQLSGQKGIHGLWESRLPELTAANYDYLVGRATYIKSPLNAAWDAVEESHAYLDSVFIIEKQLSKEFPSDQKYTFENRGQSTVKQYSREFSIAYFNRMGNMVESRMQKAIKMVGDLWFTAWVNAGQPDMKEIELGIDPSELEEQNQEEEDLEKTIPSREHD